MPIVEDAELRVERVLLRRVLWPLLLLVHAGWAASAHGADKLLLWQVTAPGVTAYLFGSLHVCSAECYPLPRAVVAALDRADTFALELDPSAPEVHRRVIERALYAEGDGLDKHIPPQMLADLEAAMAKIGAPFEPMLRMRPWMAGTTLGLIAAMQSGYKPDHGIDLWLMSRAQAQRKTIVALETADQQIDSMDKLAPEDQALLLRQSIRLIADDSLKDIFRRMIEAWRRGDAEQLDRLMRAGLENEPRAERLFDSILVQRNAGMATRIEELIAQRRSLFVVVGAGHLAGRGSLPELLRAKGYGVRQLD